MQDKKVTASITMIGGFLTTVVTLLLGFDVLPAGGDEAGTRIVNGLMETAQGIFALVTLYGIRRKMGETPTPDPNAPVAQ